MNATIICFPFSEKSNLLWIIHWELIPNYLFYFKQQAHMLYLRPMNLLQKRPKQSVCSPLSAVCNSYIYTDTWWWDIYKQVLTLSLVMWPDPIPQHDHQVNNCKGENYQETNMCLAPGRCALLPTKNLSRWMNNGKK